MPDRRQLFWVGSAREDLKRFPEDVQDLIGQALLDAQYGGKHPDAKPLQGFGGAGVLEIVEEDGSGTYRAVYTVRLHSGVYVLHAFQKKSKHGIKTDEQDLSLLRARLRRAVEDDMVRRQVGGR